MKHLSARFAALSFLLLFSSCGDYAAAWKNRKIPIEAVSRTFYSERQVRVGGINYTASWKDASWKDSSAHIDFNNNARLNNIKAEVVDGRKFKVTWNLVGHPAMVELIFVTYDKDGAHLHQVQGSEGRAKEYYPHEQLYGFQKFIEGESATWTTTEAAAKEADQILIYFKYAIDLDYNNNYKR